MIVDQCAREPGSVARAICPGHSGTTGAAQSCLGWTAPDPFPSPSMGGQLRPRALVRGFSFLARAPQSMGAPAEDFVVDLGLIDDPKQSHGLRRAPQSVRPIQRERQTAKLFLVAPA